MIAFVVITYLSISSIKVTGGKND